MPHMTYDLLVLAIVLDVHNLIGSVPWGSLEAAAAGLVAALFTGLVLGRVCRPEVDSRDQPQTDFSTTVALFAALGVALRGGAQWVEAKSLVAA